MFNHRRFGCTLLEFYFERLVDLHIAACYECYDATGLSLASHPVEIDIAQDKFGVAYAALLRLGVVSEWVMDSPALTDAQIGVN